MALREVKEVLEFESGDITRSGPILPFVFNTTNEYTVSKERLRMIHSNLSTLFSFAIGEHPVDPAFGHDLNGVFFLNFSETVKTILKVRIKELINAYEEQAEVIGIQVQQEKDKSTIFINVDFRDVMTGDVGDVSFTLSDGSLNSDGLNTVLV